MPVGLQDFLKGVKYLRAHAQGIAEGHGPDGHDHEFLNIQIIGRVRAAVDDVHHGRGQHFGVDAAEIPVQRQTQKRRGGPRAGHGHAQHGVGAQTGLVVRAVQVHEVVVDLHLTQDVHAQKRVGNLAVDVLHSPGHAFAAIALLIAVAHFQSLAAACGCAGRHSRAGVDARLQGNFHFHGGIAA